MSAKCVVLVPVAGRIEPACEAGLRALEARGYAVRRVYGFAAIDQARNQIVTDALAGGFAELMWIDADIGFKPEDVERLRSHSLPVVCGVYVKKGQRALACHVVPGTTQLIFGQKGGLVEIQYAPAGFLFTRREVYEAMPEKLNLPVCNQRFGRPSVPYFMPMVVRDASAERAAGGEGHWYLAEDFAFSERARKCGYRIWTDTTIRLSHYGPYGYTWEDAGADKDRFGTYVYRIT